MERPREHRNYRGVKQSEDKKAKLKNHDVIDRIHDELVKLKTRRVSGDSARHSQFFDCQDHQLINPIPCDLKIDSPPVRKRLSKPFPKVKIEHSTDENYSQAEIDHNFDSPVQKKMNPISNNHFSLNTKSLRDVSLSRDHEALKKDNAFYPEEFYDITQAE